MMLKTGSVRMQESIFKNLRNEDKFRRHLNGKVFPKWNTLSNLSWKFSSRVYVFYSEVTCLPTKAAG